MTEAALSGVSRETSQKLCTYAELLLKWNKAINLIGRSTEADIWSRHIADSLQLTPFLPPGPSLWADLGSGGGLPGLVLAIVAAEVAPELRFVLVESDLRKATFLREVTRQLNLAVEVRSERIENIAALEADVISARALASLTILCGFAAHHLKPSGFALFPKGGQVEAEIAEAQQTWRFDLDSLPSTTQGAARILKLKDIHHV